MAPLTPRSNRLNCRQGAALHRCAAAARASRQQHSRLLKTICILGIVVCAVSWGWRPTLAAVTVAREYQVKAIFLLNFVQFVTWPAAAFPERHTPIIIGILGNDPFGPFLEDAVRGEVIDGRPLAITRFQGVEEAMYSHILFVSKSERGRLSAILAAVQDKSILTVGDTEAFARQGGIINFITVDNKVRYEINLAAAKRAHLDISSKLLRLAKIVGPGLDN